jgi:GT2 family glycosyltransferase
MKEFVSIGITTRNRQRDLDYTLDKLLDLGLTDLPFIIFDDASDESIASEEKLKKFLDLKIIRNQEQKGLIHNRNRIVELCSTPYVISLDDDSCFANHPPLEEAINYLENNLHVVALEFANIEVNLSIEASIPSEVMMVKYYTGCGHILRCSTFLELGGYREYFIHMAEESDFAQRAWKYNYVIHSFPDIVIHHLRSPTARFPSKNAFYMARNLVLCNSLNTPIFFGILKNIYLYPSLIFNPCYRAVNLTWHLSLGWINGIFSSLIYFRKRTPMSFDQYIKYQRLPKKIINDLQTLDN